MVQPYHTALHSIDSEDHPYFRPKSWGLTCRQPRAARQVLVQAIESFDRARRQVNDLKRQLRDAKAKLVKTRRRATALHGLAEKVNQRCPHPGPTFFELIDSWPAAPWETKPHVLLTAALDKVRKATPTVAEAAENLAGVLRAAPAVAGLKDSGERRGFDTGSVRDNAEGKGRYDLLSPIALHYQARHTERGALKYSARNWEKGQPVSVFMDSAMRHLARYLAGWRDEDHLAAAAWNVHGIIHTEHQIARGQLPAALLDWPQPYVTEADVQGRVYNGEASYAPGRDF